MPYNPHRNQQDGDDRRVPVPPGQVPIRPQATRQTSSRPQATRLISSRPLATHETFSPPQATRQNVSPHQAYFPQPQDEEHVHHQFPSRSSPNFSRCCDVNLEFLWKLHHQRTNPNLNTPDTERIDTLKAQGFPTGLASLILDHALNHPIRIWLVDNCGTMHKSDGHLVSQTVKGKVKIVDCSRWEEVTSTILWHAEMAAWCQTPMAIRLLHDPGIQVGPQQVGVSASNHYSSKEEVGRLRALLKKTRPNGLTSPVYLHMKELFPSIQSMVPILHQTNKQLTLCVCTDSIPTDEFGEENPRMINEFLVTLQQLVDWPVQVVIRLSTDEERVVQFYQNLFATHSTLASHLLVLDDYVSECHQVQKHNPWLHYGYPLHLCREEGIHIPVLEALRNRPLLPTEWCGLVSLIFGVVIPMDTYALDDQYAKFRKVVKSLNKDTTVPLWNPIKKKFVPWINLKKLDKTYRNMMKKGDTCASF